MVTHGSIEVLTKEYNCLVDNNMATMIVPIMTQNEKSKIRNGVVYVITAHTTTGIAVNEGLECLEYDIGHLMERLVPEDGEYAHGRLLDTYGAMAGNPTGHLKAHLTGNHCVFPVIDGKLKSGSAQDIYLCEYDGPQYRTIYITIIGE